VVDRWREFNDIRWDAGELLNNLSGALYYADEPFTPQQTKRLLDIVKRAQTSDAYSLHDARYDWDRILVEAEAVLSPAQLQAFRARAGQVGMSKLWDAATKEAAAAAKK